MPGFTIHNVRTISRTRPFEWEGEVQVGTNPNRAPFKVQHRDSAMALKAFGGRVYPPFSYNHETPPNWDDVQPLIVDGLRQLMARDTFKTFADIQGWRLDEGGASPGGAPGPAAEDTPVKITVRYQDGHRNRPILVALREIPALLADPDVAGIDVVRATDPA